MSNKIMVQHLFPLNSVYRTPDGKVYKVVCSEVWNLRCFELVNGDMAGPMMRIHPESELAKSLVRIG